MIDYNSYNTGKETEHNYFSLVYEKLFDHLRGAEDMRLLELGTWNGEGLMLWREFFGGGSSIVGIDMAAHHLSDRFVNNPDPKIETYTGDHGDHKLLDEVAEKHGPFDVVIDDGGHIGTKMIESFEGLWKHLKIGGIYVVEDFFVAWGTKGHPHNADVIDMITHITTRLPEIGISELFMDYRYSSGLMWMRKSEILD